MKKNYTLLNFVIALLFASQLTAQTFVKSDATGSNDGTSWANAYSDLSDALSNSAPMDEIWVAAGTYKPGGATPDTTSFFTFPHDLLLFGGFAGTETMVTERDWTTNETILSGDHLDNDVDNDFDTFRDDNSQHVMWLTDTVTIASTVDGFTVRSGDTSPGAASGDDRRGGGILTYGAPAIRNCLFTQNNGYYGGGLYPRGSATAAGVIIENCVFENNNSGRQGGGIHLLSGTATISDCTFTGNNAANRGGAIYNNATASDIMNCTFLSNSVPTSAGGALMIRNGNTNDFDPVNIINCTFEENDAGFGGALGVYDTKSIANITDCDFIQNDAATSGGATTNGFGATSNFTNCVFSQNEATNGGAIYSQNDDATINITNCEISLNAATRGGAINIGNGDIIDTLLPIPILTVENTIIQLNSAIEQGGGVNLGSSSAVFKNVLFDSNIITDAASIGGAISINTSDTITATIDLINCTVVNNEATLGAGISHWIDGDLSSSTLTLQNTVFDNPIGNDYEIEAGAPILISNGGNLSADLSMFDELVATNDIAGENPLFVDFDDEDYHLANGSPCIDAGIEAGAPILDLDGLVRVDGVDMGVYENQKVVSVFNLPRTLGELDIFPNPVQDDLNFTFESSFNGDLEVMITDVKGQQIIHFVMEKSTEKISRVHNVTNLPKGVYQLTISNGNELTTKAFVK